MSTRTLTAPQFRRAPRTRKTILVLHVISSVAILGQVWGNAVLAVLAMPTPDLARAAYHPRPLHSWRISPPRRCSSCCFR